MNQSAIFEWVASQIEGATGWNRLAARGTVRLALKDMGFEPRTIDKRDMAAVLRMAMVKVLEAHRVANARPLCERLEKELWSVQIAAAVESPESVFKRLGRS
jgi:hypothetical protein